MRVIRYRDLKPQKGITHTRQHLLREEAAGRFPRRLQIGPNTVAWDEQEIDDWLASKPYVTKATRLPNRPTPRPHRKRRTNPPPSPALTLTTAS
jgi:prophage regulatory protein